MHRLALVLPALLLSGCDLNPEKVIDLLMGRETNTVVLVKQPMLLNPEVSILTSQEPMKVLGEWTSLCLSLRGGIPMQDAKEMDRVFEEAMHNTRVKVYLTLSNGNRVALRPPLQAWSMRGKVVEHDELSACASTPCKAELPVGTQVTKVEISADRPLQVQGIFWESERGVNEKPAFPSQTDAASAPKKASSCSA